MVKYCYTHKAQMPEKTSKTKRNPDGSYKVYNSHMDIHGKMCFGVGEPPKEDKGEWVEENIEASKEMVEEIKDDLEDVLPDEVEDKPMTRLDWNEKEWIKGLGVFSSAARGEGMTPQAAAETMSMWEWMDLAYGDMPGYEEWKAKAKKRIK